MEKWKGNRIGLRENISICTKKQRPFCKTTGLSSCFLSGEVLDDVEKSPTLSQH